MYLDLTQEDVTAVTDVIRYKCAREPECLKLWPGH